MTWKRWTAVMIVGSAGVLVGYDIVAIAFGGDGVSVSAAINEAAYERTRTATAIGILIGGLAVHLLGWSPTRGK